MNKERKEALIRIPIIIICAIIAELWGILVLVLAVLNFLIVLFTGKRSKDLTNFTNIYVSFVYAYARYALFATNIRPFPFNKLKEVEKSDFKSQN